jgi:hypothetical protein
MASMSLPANIDITNAQTGNFSMENFVTEDRTAYAHESFPTSTVAAVKVGVHNTKLSFSQSVTLSIDVSPAYNNQSMYVFYQEDGETTWHNQTMCTITDGKCSFLTNHATTYTVKMDGSMVGETGINLNTDIQEIISLDCNGAIVNLGNLTPGTPVTGSSICTSTTNANGGYILSVKKDSTTTLQKNTELTTTIPDKTAWDPTGNGNAQIYSGTGLGFTVYDSTATKNQTWWGTGTTVTDANNKYAGFDPNQTDIMQHTAYSDVSTTASIGYKLDVEPTQKSGAYSGSITYQVTTSP